ncbi:MAG TPA: hypothetical protein VEZ46_03495, partial [Mycobacteriales bacterium]|nr:hypothetical protein [Mycobacteriales bacterium]
MTTTDEATGELRAARPAGADPLADGAPPPDGAGGNSSSRPTVTGEQVWRAVRLPIGILFLVLLLVLLVIIIGTPRRTGRLE